MHVAGRGVLHLLQGAINVAVVVLVVPCDVHDLGGERLVGPLDAPGLFVDVAGEDHKVNVAIEGRRVEPSKFGMEV